MATNSNWHIACLCMHYYFYSQIQKHIFLERGRGDEARERWGAVAAPSAVVVWLMHSPRTWPGCSHNAHPGWSCACPEAGKSSHTLTTWTPGCSPLARKLLSPLVFHKNKTLNCSFLKTDCIVKHWLLCLFLCPLLTEPTQVLWSLHLAPWTYFLVCYHLSICAPLQMSGMTNFIVTQSCCDAGKAIRKPAFSA